MALGVFQNIPYCSTYPMLSFVIQQHQKSPEDLHFDFMLEREGVLVTWSFPNPPEKGKLWLGKRIFDHRLKYLTFEGEIGRGLGRVEIWDRGTYQPVAWKENRMEILLRGEKISGLYLLSLAQGPDWTLERIGD